MMLLIMMQFPVPMVHSALCTVHSSLDTEKTAVQRAESGAAGPDLTWCVCNVGH